MGDQNAVPNDGDSYNQTIVQLLQNPAINTNGIPTSPGGTQQSGLQRGANLNHRSNPAFDTADFADGAPGNLRTDYVLPSVDLGIQQSGIFWSLNTDPTFSRVGTLTPPCLVVFRVPTIGWYGWMFWQVLPQLERPLLMSSAKLYLDYRYHQ